MDDMKKIKVCRETIEDNDCRVPGDCLECFLEHDCHSVTSKGSIYAARKYLAEHGILVLNKPTTPIIPESAPVYNSGIIETSTGDIVPIQYIDEVGLVKESVSPKTIYRKILFWVVAWEQEDVVDGYYFLIHTIGGIYNRVSRPTKDEAEKVRRDLLDAITGRSLVMDDHR